MDSSRREALFLNCVKYTSIEVYVAQTKQQTLIERIQRKINKLLTLSDRAQLTRPLEYISRVLACVAQK